MSTNTEAQTETSQGFLRRLFSTATRVSPELQRAAEEYHIATAAHHAALKKLESVAEKS